MQLKLNKIFVAVTVILITAIGQSAAQSCNSFDDCPGSDVCCFIGSGFCIRFDQCANVEDNGFEDQEESLMDFAIEENARLAIAWFGKIIFSIR
ncbi:hypothetical protein D9758_010452 [Tetrapyrgos nigripes]|uniref:Uncharacterized protein n=1 Tax=Tetrapyrgos nigripes TaxID=182062 RepID=A0A8H5FQ68_9AGAR|nr:hypothetical protein D9758_010452 [Tetrapyrgos nigripes]